MLEPICPTLNSKILHRSNARRLGSIYAVRVILGIAAVMIAACHKSPTDSSATYTAAATSERTLIRGNGSEPDSLDPQKARTYEADTILRDLYECLTSLDHEGHPAPGAARTWSISPDGQTYTFTLRSDGRWSNGEPVKAGDFVAGLRRLVDPATASEDAGMIDVIRRARDVLVGKLAPDQLGVAAPDDSTVVIELEHPAPYLPGLLAHPSTCPIYRPSLAQAGGFARPRVMVSNGPFVLSEWIQGDHLAATRNRFYRDDAHTFWDRVVYLQIADANAEYMRYQAGQIDITMTIPRSQFSEIQKHYPTELHLGPYFGTDYYGFNLNRQPFRDNTKLRQALNIAIDRERLAEVVLRTGETPAFSWVPSGVDNYAPQAPAFRRLLPPARALLAQQLYKEAGYSRSRPLHVELRYNAGDAHTRLAVAISSMWKETLGADVQLTTEDFRALLNDVDTGQVELFRLGWNADYNDALAFLQMLRSNSGVNLTHYHNEEFDRLLDLAAAEPDALRRAEDLEAAERLVLEDTPLIPVYFYVSKHLVAPTIHGWYANPLNVVYSKDLSRQEVPR